MIVDMPDTTTSDVAKELVKLREEGGVVTLGRVLTLVISTHIGNEEEAIEAANDASREHPMRIIVVSKPRPGDPSARLGFGFVCNRSGRSWRDPRNIALIDAVYASL